MSSPGSPLDIGNPQSLPATGLLQLLQSAMGGASPQGGAAPAGAPQAAPPAPAPPPTPQPPAGGPKPPPNVGDIVNFHKFAGGNPADPNAWTPLQGPEFLQNLHQQNPVFANQIQAIIDGRQKMPSQSRMNPTNKMIINAVYQADPDNFDAVNSGARQKVRDDFTSGNSALNIRNINQSIGHLQAMLAEMPNVAGHQIPLIGTTVNSLINSAEKGSGDPGITNYQTAQTALASEMASLLKGKGSSNETEVQSWLGQLSPDRSDAQKLGGAQKLVELLKSRLDELNQQYQQGMGTTATPFQVLNPLAANAYKQLSVMGKTMAGAQTPQANPAVDALLQKYGAQ